MNTNKGGYDVEFVGKEPKHITCSICLYVLKEPMQARQCGHRFCKSCVGFLQKRCKLTLAFYLTLYHAVLKNHYFNYTAYKLFL